MDVTGHFHGSANGPDPFLVEEGIILGELGVQAFSDHVRFAMYAGVLTHRVHGAEQQGILMPIIISLTAVPARHSPAPCVGDWFPPPSFTEISRLSVHNRRLVLPHPL